MKNLDTKTLRKIIEKSKKELRGDWLIIGGTVLPLLGIEHRFTTDLDIVGLFETNMSDTLKLMEIAESFQLPVESINQAGAFFLKKIPDYRKHIILFDKGKRCRIYYPDLYLFTRLKVGRLSESDMEDILLFVEISKKDDDLLKKTLKFISEELRRTKSSLKKKKLIKIRKKLESLL